MRSPSGFALAGQPDTHWQKQGEVWRSRCGGGQSQPPSRFRSDTPYPELTFLRVGVGGPQLFRQGLHRSQQADFVARIAV